MPTHLDMEVKSVTVSMRVMTAGHGYRYLLRSVASGDGDRSLSTPLSRYYAEAGTPPGRWTGSGLAEFGDGRLSEGGQVTETQLALLIGRGRDPVTGEQLGRAYPEYKPPRKRVEEQVRGFVQDLDATVRAEETARAEAEEAMKQQRRPVAGFDFTFSVPKSVSVLWAVADANVQEVLVAAHHAAVAEVLDFLEREIAATRTGVANRDGAVAQVEVAGVVAAAFDHWDSRAGDPQLHTHLVVSNKVKTLLDNRWRSLDGRPIHHAVTALSAYYNSMLADRLTGTLGLAWEWRERGPDRNPQWEIAGVPDALINEFSARTRAIEDEKERLIEGYFAAHGRRPTNAKIVELRAQATLATRPEKQVRPLSDLTAQWRTRASGVISGDPTVWARDLLTRHAEVLEPAQVPEELIEQLGRRVVAEVGKVRTTWRHWNLWAEASRQTMGWRFAAASDRERVVAKVVEAAAQASLTLTPAELAPSPPEFQREDGTSVFRPRHSAVYSSDDMRATEVRLLARAKGMGAPAVPAAAVEKVIGLIRVKGQMSQVQADAVAEIAASARQVDLLVGPAGAGKTTTMRALRAAWIGTYGQQSVIGLATSAAAADVLAEDLGIPCENTAKWLTEHNRENPAYVLQPDQLVIIDEASMADTRSLDRITAAAVAAGAKVLLVGDPAQIDAVEAGGAFALLVARRDDVPELTEIHRFVNQWEARSSLDLRDGKARSISTYARHDRLREGSTDGMLEGAYLAWQQDLAAGKAALLIGDTTDQIHTLNERARAARIQAGEIATARETTLADEHRASVGDWVITRQNDRSIRSATGAWVRNGHRWRVLEVGKDGSLTVRRQHGRNVTVTLPMEYVREWVDLGYAVTVHRAEGITVDTAHVLVTAKTTREHLYVAMTRGRESNTAYVALDRPDSAHTAPDDLTAVGVLAGVLNHSGAELSVHQTIEVESETYSSIAQLAAEYETLAAAAQYDRWKALVSTSGLPPEVGQAVVAADAFGPLAAALRQAEAADIDVSAVFNRAVHRGTLADAEDPAAVLHHRVRLAIAGRRPPRLHLIAGLIPEARGAIRDDYRKALAERAALIETRASALAEHALRTRAPWVHRLTGPPADPIQAAQWRDEIATIAAYRDRYDITSEQAIERRVRSAVERADAQRARAALRRAEARMARAPARDGRSPEITLSGL